MSLSTPMIRFLKPEIILINNNKCIIEIKLNRKSKNTWNTMFFGAIATGIDLTGGFLASDIASKSSVGVLYKDVQIKFLRRVDGDIKFHCNDGINIKKAVEDALSSGKRININVSITGFVDNYSITEPVVSAEATLSFKKL